jgi:hypothetical protein
VLRNLGLPGVIIGIFLIGLLYRAVIAMYVHAGMGMGALSGAIYVSSRIFDIGSATSMVLGGLPWDMLAMGIFSLVIELIEIDARTVLPLGRSA